MRVVSISLVGLLLMSGPVAAQETNPIIESMMQEGLSEQEATARYRLDIEAQELHKQLIETLPDSFAGIYGDASSGDMRIFVRLTGDAPKTLAEYTSNPAFVAVQANVPLRALENRQVALLRSLAARGIQAGASIDFRLGKVRVTTKDRGKALQAVPGLEDDDVDILEGDPLPVPAATINGGKQITYQSISGSTLTSDRGSLGFAIKSGTTNGILTAAHFGRCKDPSGATVPGCVVNGPAFFNPNNQASGVISGTPTLTWKGERLGGSYDAEWRTSSSDTFPNVIQDGTTTMAVTQVSDPDWLIVNSSKVCKQGFKTGRTCGTFREKYLMPWFGSDGYHYLVSNDAGGMMADGGDSGGPVYAAASAIGIVSGVFTNPSSSRYNWMSFTSAKLAASALGVTIKVAP